MMSLLPAVDSERGGKDGPRRLIGVGMEFVAPRALQMQRIDGLNMLLGSMRQVRARIPAKLGSGRHVVDFRRGLAVNDRAVIVEPSASI